jgi:hypothetical protein
VSLDPLALDWSLSSSHVGRPLPPRPLCRGWCQPRQIPSDMSHRACAPTATDTAAWGWSSWFAAAVQVHPEDGEDRAVERELQSPTPPPQGRRAGARARRRPSPREM